MVRKGLYILVCVMMTFSFGAMSFNYTNQIAQANTDDDRIADLRRQIADLEAKAAAYQKSISSKQSEGQTLKRDIAILQDRIYELQAQISATGRRIDSTSIEIGGVEENIYTTTQRISSRKQTIGTLLTQIDQSENENLLETLLKNDNLSDFFKHEEYNRKISESLVEMVNDLKDSKNQLEQHRTNLEGMKQNLETLHTTQVVQRGSLTTVNVSKNDLLAKTKGQEAEYKKLLANVEKQKAAFFNELRSLESKAISGGTYIVHITATALPPKGTKLFSMPEDRYKATQGYGLTSYAKSGAYGGSPHNGIDIAGGAGTPIKSIGDGEIVANGTNSGWGNWVAIKHVHNLVSIYGHMSAFAPLRVGTKVKVGEVIGYEGSTGNSTGSHLHLSLYKEFFTYVNPVTGLLNFNYFQGTINPYDYL